MEKRVKEIIDGVVRVLTRELPAKRIILFGSRAKMNACAGSDLDIAVDCERPPVGKQREIREEIDMIAGLYKVDIVYMPSVDDGFRKIIEKTGKVVYER